MLFLADKKKSGKRVKIVEPQQQQQINLNKAKKQKIEETNGSSQPKVKKAVKESAGKSNGSSIDEGKKMFEWMITPVTVDDFMK